MALIGKKGAKEQELDDTIEYLDLQDYRFDTSEAFANMKAVKVVDVERAEHVSRAAKIAYQKNIVIIDISNANKDPNNTNQIEVSIRKLVKDINGDFGKLGEFYYILVPSDVRLDKKKVRDDYI
ncbi:MAG: cell division protein SepF [Cuniculiplasma sp.]